MLAKDSVKSLPSAKCFYFGKTTFLGVQAVLPEAFEPAASCNGGWGQTLCGRQCLKCCSLISRLKLYQRQWGGALGAWSTAWHSAVLQHLCRGLGRARQPGGELCGEAPLVFLLKREYRLGNDFKSTSLIKHMLSHMADTLALAAYLCTAQEVAEDAGQKMHKWHESAAHKAQGQAACLSNLLWDSRREKVPQTPLEVTWASVCLQTRMQQHPLAQPSLHSFPHCWNYCRNSVGKLLGDVSADGTAILAVDRGAPSKQSEGTPME